MNQQGAQFLVIACNTASALALDAIQETVPVPVLGVIEPGAAAAAARTFEAAAQNSKVKTAAYRSILKLQGLI